MIIVQLYIALAYVLIVFEPEDDPLWLKHVAEINSRPIENTAGLTALYFLFCNTTGL
jgi:hypothetical protein